MSYPVKIYVNSVGTTFGASQTDQRHTTAKDRTVGGAPVAYAGEWSGSQMGYAPFKRAVAEAKAKAKVI